MTETDSLTERWTEWRQQRRELLLGQGVSVVPACRIAHLEAKARSNLEGLVGADAAGNARLVIRIADDGRAQVLASGDLNDIPPAVRPLMQQLGNQILATL